MPCRPTPSRAALESARPNNADRLIDVLTGDKNMHACMAMDEHLIGF